jgi:hypothetical protein
MSKTVIKIGASIREPSSITVDGIEIPHVTRLSIEATPGDVPKVILEVTTTELEVELDDADVQVEERVIRVTQFGVGRRKVEVDGDAAG